MFFIDCPVCGVKVEFFDICDVCDWHNSGGKERLDTKGGNKMTLREAKEKYLEKEILKK